MLNNKAISPVVATALLLVVTVVSVVGFQGWFQTYSSIMFSNVEQESSFGKMNTVIETIIGNNLYFKNGFSNLDISEIKLGDVSCPINLSIESGMQIINISSCLDLLLENTNEVVVVTNQGLFTKYISLSTSCVLDGVRISEGGSENFYNSTSVSFDSSCSLEPRICNNGEIDGNSSFMYANCSIEAQDITPDFFSFVEQTGVGLNTIIESNVVIPNGYDGSLSVEVIGEGSPTLNVNNNSWVTSGNINLGETLQLRLTSSNTYDTARSVTVTLGNYSTIWNVTTWEAPLSCNTDSDSNSFISYLCGKYPMLNTALEGHLDPDDSISAVEPNINCVWKDDKSGCEINFVVNGCGSGTVLNTATGLCWQRDFGIAGLRTWTDAKNYCNGLSLGGKTDWYLPSYNEILTVVDLSRYSPAVVGGNNNKFQNIANTGYWTKTTYGQSTGDAFRINLYQGTVYGYAKTSTSYVTCVRRN